MIQPNENGVYPKSAADCVAFPNPKGQVHCEIYALNVDDVWLGAYSYQMGGTDQRGGGGPLMKRSRFPDFSDRQACIAHEAGRLLKGIQTNDCKQAPAIRDWLKGLIDGPDQFDMFAEA